VSRGQDSVICPVHFLRVVLLKATWVPCCSRDGPMVSTNLELLVCGHERQILSVPLVQVLLPLVLVLIFETYLVLLVSRTHVLPTFSSFAALGVWHVQKGAVMLVA
jgi:hypothetical protein